MLNGKFYMERKRVTVRERRAHYEGDRIVVFNQNQSVLNREDNEIVSYVHLQDNNAPLK